MKANEAPEQYISKSALVAEIESKFQKYWKLGEESDALQDGNAKYWGGVLSCLNEVKTLINTLEVKEANSKLTLEDISMLRQIMFDYNRQVRNEMSIPNNEDYCKEVLKRFKAQKGEEV